MVLRRVPTWLGCTAQLFRPGRTCKASQRAIPGILRASWLNATSYTFGADMTEKLAAQERMPRIYDATMKQRPAAVTPRA